MVTDDEQGDANDEHEYDEIGDQGPSKKRAKINEKSKNPKTSKTSKKLQVTHHQALVTTPTKVVAHTRSQLHSSNDDKTPLKQFANTVSPSPSTSVSRVSPKSTAVPLSTPSIPTLSKVTSLPTKALPYVKNVLNIQGAHVHNHLSFLQEPRDAQGRRPGEFGYDPRTLKVVPADWDAHMGKMTNAVQQWWDLKSQYFDTVLLFKTGKLSIQSMQLMSL